MKFPSIVFFGTPPFAAQVLEHLIKAGVPISAIVTQPDRPKGRSLQLTPSAVKVESIRLMPPVPIFQPLKCSDPEFLRDIAAVQATLFVVVAFGQILPQKLLDVPSLGCINVHASLLPKYRGAAPIQRCLINGDAETGIAIQKMVRELDAGDVICAEKIKVPEEMTYGELEQALCELAKPLLLNVLSDYTGGIPAGVPQDLSGVTYAAKIEPEEGEIHWQNEAKQIHNLIRAFNPRPGAWTSVEMNGSRKKIKILRSKIVQGIGGDPGTLLSIKELIIGCGQGSLEILEVQPEGKSRMLGAEWLRGAKQPVKFTLSPSK